MRPPCESFVVGVDSRIGWEQHRGDTSHADQPCPTGAQRHRHRRRQRPLIVVELVGAAPFAATNARIQRASTVARAAAPLLLGVAATAFGWPTAWAGCLVVFAAAGERYVALGRSGRD